MDFIRSQTLGNSCIGKMQKFKGSDDGFRQCRIRHRSLVVAFGYRMHGIISNVLEWQVHRIASAITAGPVDVEDKAKWEKLTDKEKKEKYLLLFREAETACYTTHIIGRLKPYEKYKVADRKSVV